MFQRCFIALTAAVSLTSALPAGDGNRLTYLDDPANPYYVHRNFPKLTTPMWVGEEGVEAVVILAIDDMRGHEKWEAYLRPILERLKKIDGRAPVSIMTCSIDPQHEHLQKWLKEGVSLECHTIDHPCPILRDGDFAKAKSTYDRCVDLMSSIPNSKPVAFRTPCCDSLNTNSPRLYAEIFNRTTPLAPKGGEGPGVRRGNFLHIDSSVFNLFTANDPSLPRDLVLDADGRERFRKYLPRDRSFVNVIEDYPYPYVIDRLCWQFPCMTPSDWQAQHLHKPNNPITVRDWQAALDCTVLKQGVFCMVFHPHGWIKSEQVIDFIDYAERKHGKKVKFLNFREALERVNKNLLGGQALRDDKGRDNGVRMLDVNDDGWMDVVVGNKALRKTRLWQPEKHAWTESAFPRVLIGESIVKDGLERFKSDVFANFGILGPEGLPAMLWTSSSTNSPGGNGFTTFEYETSGWHFDGKGWREEKSISRLPGDVEHRHVQAPDGVRLRDLNSDGICELLIGTRLPVRTVLLAPGIQTQVTAPVSWTFEWDQGTGEWKKLPFQLPQPTWISDSTASDSDAGLRFIDLDGDGHDDIVFSNEERYGIWLFESMEKGWSREVVSAKRQAAKADVIPPITIKGANNGFFVHSKHLWWQNEHTNLLKDHMDRRSFAEPLKDVPTQPKSPQASLKSIQCRPGFTVELVAAEPLVQDPIAFAFGPDGKLWVVEMGDYPLGVEPPSPPAPLLPEGRGEKKGGGKVRFLEDTDGDGKYDKSTIFLDGLAFPTGVLPWRNGVLVTCAPDILYAEDTDGDGKADKRVVLFTGFKEGNQQHRVNGLSYGLDGWVYGANGDSGGKIKSCGGIKTGETQHSGLSTQHLVDISGRDFRFKPDTGEFEAVTGQTQYGRSRDDWGNWFGGNNSNPLWHYVLEDRYLKRNPHFAPPNPRVDVPMTPGQSPVFPISRTLPRFNDFHTANRFTSACSPTFYRDDLFGPHFANSVFICEPVHNLVSRQVVSPEGVTFRSRRAPGEEQSEFLASTDNWFRPVFAQTGPDGAMWIADMYRHVIEHPEWIPKATQKTLDLRAGHDKGRIYRVYPVDKKPRPIPRLDKLSTEKLVKALDSPNGWQRDMAQMLLFWRKDPVANAPLAYLARISQRPETRVQALYALDQTPSNRMALPLKLAFEDKHPAVRRHALALWEPRLSTSSDLCERMAKMVDDPDPTVRMQLAYTLGAWDHPPAGEALGKLAVMADGDRYLTAAVMSSLNAKNIEAVLAAALANGRGANQETTGRLLGTLVRLAYAFGNKKAVLACLSELRPPQAGWRLEPWKLDALAALLDALEERGSSLGKWKAEFANDKDAAMALQSIHDYFFVAREIVRSEPEELEHKLRAVRLLGRGLDEQEEDLRRLARLLEPTVPHALQSAAAQAVARSRSLLAPVHLLQGWKSHSPALRAEILDMLFRKPEGVITIVAALEQKTILPVDIDAARRQRLLDHEKPSIRELAAKLFAGSIDKDRQKVLDAFRSVLMSKGDAAKGQPIFVKNCSACHKLAGVGNEVGPDLAAMKDKSPAVLLEAILDPNRAVEARYVSYTALTQNGLTLTGLLHTETSNSITLIGVDGKPQTILRTNLDRLMSTGKSAMPDGIEKDVTPEQMADLLAFLTSSLPQPKRKEFVGNQPQLVRSDANGILNLRAENAEIYGTSLVFEPQFANLGWWTNQDDHAVWMMEVPRAAKYAVHFNYACADSAAGDSFVLAFGDHRLSGKVAGTGEWESYRQVEVGAIELPAGQLRVVMRSEGRIRSALIDLRTIRLTPAK